MLYFTACPLVIANGSIVVMSIPVVVLKDSISFLNAVNHFSLISDILSGLSIEEHRKKYSQKLSGGTKRKLCYAMRIIGFPRIVIMDEPSTGMDPHSKRYLWNTVLGTFKGSLAFEFGS